MRPVRPGKKIIALLLAGALSASLLAAPAFSAEEVPAEQPEAQAEPAQPAPEYIAEPAEETPAEPPQSEPSDAPAPAEQPAEPVQDEPSQEAPAQGDEVPAPDETVREDETPAPEETAQSGGNGSAEDAASSEQDAADFATETVVSSYSAVVGDDSGIATNPSGSITVTLRGDNVANSVAEAGYFPSKSDILSGRVPSVFTASMILWHRNNGAACYRIKDTTTFASAFGGTAQYTPRPGDLIYYQAYQDEYDAGVITSGNSNWLHTGIVAEVGEDYIVTIEGNTSQRVSKLTLTRTSGVIGHYTDYRRSWIVNVFGDDDEARASFAETAWQAWYDAEADAQAGRAGFGTWRESRYNGVYQNDTIASGYFQMPAAWCQMFVLWCAFNADVVRTGTVRLSVSSAERPFLSVIAQGQSLEGYTFCFYPAEDGADYASMEPCLVLTTDVNGLGEGRRLVYGRYHVEQTDGPQVVTAPFELELAEKELELSLRLPDAETPDTDGIVSALVDNLAASFTGHLGKMRVQALPDSAFTFTEPLSLPGLSTAADQPRSARTDEHVGGALTVGLTDATAVLSHSFS